jgi:cobalt-zinc-cadmium efflux system membrane fusion protein
VVLQSVVPPGAHVRKGQVIAEFDRQYQLVRLDDFRAAMHELDQGLRTLREALDVEARAHKESIQAARASLDKARYDLKTTPVQSAIAAEKLKLAEQEAEAQYKQLVHESALKEASRAAEWRLNSLERDQARIELGRAEANANKMLVRAPLDGTTVMSSTFRGGEFGQIRAGDELHPGMLFLKIVDPGSMTINASVNQADIELLRVGATARVHFDAYPDLELPARVYSIGAMPKSGGFRAAYVKEVPVLLKLDRLDPRVIPDLSVAVDVSLASERAPVVVPREAVFEDAPGSTPPARPYVFVAEGGTWQRREIETGLASNIAVAVRSGLRPGEIVATGRPPQENR